MAERVRQERQVRRADSSGVDLSTSDSVSPADYDAILDEIDEVLEADAEEYVRAFVQKGGQ